MRTQKGFSSFRLKIFALVFMTIDHIAATGLANQLGKSFVYINEINQIMHIFGRIAAPIFLFLIVQGVRHTHSKSQYVLRLYCASIVIGIANRLFEQNVEAASIYGTGNILPTLMYTALYIVCIEWLISSLKGKRYANAALSVGVIVVPILSTWLFRFVSRDPSPIWIWLRIIAPPLTSVMFSYVFILLGITWYFVNSKLYNLGVFVVLSAVCGFVDAGVIAHLPYPINAMFELFIGTQWCMILATPFIALYNGERGRSCKYLFYAYYPIHQYALFLLVNCLI
jgi:hypothetical protein